jgi:hypothetical protein
MNQVNIVYSPSGLGTPGTGQDFLSGMIFYGAPSGLTFQALSIQDAITAGITANTIANVSAATYNDVIYYHINEFFRGNPTGQLFVQTVTSGSSATYSEIVSQQLAAGGIIRQTGIFETVSYTGLTTNLEAIQGQVNTNISDNMPMEVVYNPNFSGLTNLSTLLDLSTQLNPNVSVMFGQDGANLGAALFAKLGYSIGCMGICLGRISAANVANSIAWVGQNNIADVEDATPAFANGTLYSNVSTNQISQIDAKQYIFFRTFVDLSGTYFNNDYTANLSTSDYSSIHLNRVIHKAARQVRSNLLPSLASPVYFNPNGTIAIGSVVYFQSLCNSALATMVSNSELSQFKTIINSAQNVLATKTLVITLQLIPVGVADTITVNLGFVLSV